jgi:hypothetical protein
MSDECFQKTEGGDNEIKGMLTNNFKLDLDSLDSIPENSLKPWFLPADRRYLTSDCRAKICWNRFRRSEKPANNRHLSCFLILHETGACY